MKKIWESSMPHAQFKQRYKFFADTPNIAGNCRVIEKIYDGEPNLTVFSNVEEDVH
jgi:hypothetical protein